MSENSHQWERKKGIRLTNMEKWIGDSKQRKPRKTEIGNASAMTREGVLKRVSALLSLQ